MGCTVSQAVRRGKNLPEGEKHVCNRLEATESRISFINCRMEWRGEEGRAGIGVASKSLFKNVDAVLGPWEDGCGF